MRSEAIVEIACIFHILKLAEKAPEYAKLCKTEGIPIEKFIPSLSLSMLKEKEWRSKIESFLNKNAYLKKQNIPNLKKKFLNFLVESPCFTSSTYSYSIEGEATFLVKKNGVVVVNIFGIFFYSKNRFRKPKIHIKLEEVQNLEIKADHLMIEFIDDENQVLKKIKVISPMKNDIAYDVVSYMLVAMREHKRLYYSYNFLSKFIADGRTLNSINDDPVTQS